MVERSSNTQLLSFFADLVNFGRLDLEPSWQRKAGVWTADYKGYFIDSILRNYPFPSLLLNARTGADGTTIYEVVDGKQRLTTIIDFLQDRLATSEEHSDDLGAPRYFSEFSVDEKKAFYRYEVTVETIKDGTLDELRQAFDRLNRNVARLNAQELRHAAYSGRFIQVMEALADDELWTEVGVATAARTRRMLDIQFVSQIFILTMHGIQDGDDNIDEFYAEYDEEIPNERKHRKTYTACKAIVSALQAEEGLIRNTRFSNLADLYSLWAACREVVLEGSGTIDVPATAEALWQFAQDIDNTATAEAGRYLIAARQGSNKGANRQLRADTIRGKFVLDQ